jgi:hypothetical protein
MASHSGELRHGRPGGELADPSQPGTSRPSAVGTQRRLRALAARSWSPRAIEQETGIPAWLVKRELDGYDDLVPNLADAVAAAYDRLWDRDPPAITRADREAGAAVAARAAARGWAPPMAWDDDQIDLPDGRPGQGWRPFRDTYRSADLVEDAEFVREHGGYQDATTTEVAVRLGVRRDRLDQAYHRVRRYAARAAADRSAAKAEPEPEPEAEAG